jgi:hypothetical protein
MLTRVRDIIDADDDQFITDAVLLRWLNAAVPRLDSMIARAGWIMNTITDNQDMAATVFPYMTLTREALAIVAVYESPSSSSASPRFLRSVSQVEALARTRSGASQANWFYVKDEDDGAGATNTQVYPVPDPASGTYATVYIPHGYTLVAGTEAAGETNEVKYPGGWEEWLVLETARQALGREEVVSSNIEERKREIERGIEQMSSDRLFTQGPRVRNVSYQGTDLSARLDTVLYSPESWLWL